MMIKPLATVAQALPKTILEAASASRIQIQSTHAVRPPLLNRLAALYYGLSFGLYMYIWIVVIILCTRYPILIGPVAMYTIYIYGPGAQPSYDGSWSSTPWKRWGMWRAVADYFPQCRIHKTAEFPPEGKYIIGYHPHGVLAFGGWLAFGTDALGFRDLYPSINPRVLTLNINFRAPFLREYLLLHGVCSVSRHAILNLLNLGRTVVIVLGGGSESLLARPGRYDLVLRRRRGFVKIALETGASLVPCVGFGEPETFRTINQLPESSAIRKFQVRLEKLLGFTVPLAFGMGVFLPYGLLPYPVPINVVIGAPINVPHHTGEARGAAYEAMVDKYHGQYIAALQKLYEDHREKFAKGAEDMKLQE